MDTERNWAIIIVSTEFLQTFEAYLPVDHRLLAARHLDDGTDECLVSGPYMPVAEPGKLLPRTDMRFTVDEAATWGYWTHAPDKRWRVS